MLTSATLKSTSSVLEINKVKPPFGSRFLTDDANVWSQNAWDHVPPPENQEEIIEESLAKQRLVPVPIDKQSKYNSNPSRHWDNFYKMNSKNFFRNRKWLHNEFPELSNATRLEAGPMVIAEIGCGAGNSVFPVLSDNGNPRLQFHAYDYSSHAIKLVQTDPLYCSPPTGSIEASVWDLSSPDGLPSGLEPGSVDIVVLVFVLSALHPNDWDRAITNIYKMLRPGGLVVFRDYGRYDLTQLRFKENRLLEENFYIRGDKTRVYFFELDELALLFTGSRFPKSQLADISTRESHVVEPAASLSISATNLKELNSIHPNLLSPRSALRKFSAFTIEQLGIDRRLLVNRKRELKMYRNWVQGKFRKKS